MPRVLNLRDFPGGVPDGAIYCSRPMRRHHLGGSPFANPFKLGRKATDTERAESIAMYERWLMMQPSLLAKLPTLAGHDLACWCAPLPCHCDVLMRLAIGDRYRRAAAANLRDRDLTRTGRPTRRAVWP